MYPFLTMNDHTEIVYSHLLDGGGVKIYVEKPDEYDGFHHAACFLPGCRWEDIVGFSDAEIQEYQKVIESSAEQITRLAASGKGGMIADERPPLFIEHFVSMVSTILKRHSTVVVLCLFTLSKEQEVEKCMC